MYYFDSAYFLILIPFFILSAFVSNKLKAKFKKFSQQTLSANLSGKEIAEKMLSDHGIYDVKVISVKGQLTDHYNPQKKTVNLSTSVYNERNAAAAAVAAHECGHAVQHARGYEWLKMRSILVPMVGITSNLAVWILFLGTVLMTTSPVLGQTAISIGIFGFASGTLFSLITLPVEFDASKRALKILAKYVPNKNMKQCRSVLRAAALTYLAQSIVSIFRLKIILLSFVNIFKSLIRR